MSIVTKKGDEGKTALYFGGRVNKNSPRVDCYGILDELCSFLGMARSLIKEKEIKKLLESIQRDLFAISAEIATVPKFIHRLKKRAGPGDVARIEEAIKTLERKKVFEGCCFYLPGEDFTSSVIDVSRTIARRAERKIISLKSKGLLDNPAILRYANRLSDLLYLLTRSQEKYHRKL